ncbi:ZIP family metal transporter [Peptacetobacter hominis]|uniref:ZIP family metal transporter n=1 Tax=Peptacetobacter hominis TaxID=2743610 RepID=A0A544QTH1_9FIRM|nr:ZIP family metal transporter [Peptacetobacter hominis]TQQ83991.1 ZIP family metal transporter [Peptacetobacter hominis]
MIWEITLIGLLAGVVGTGLGGLLASIFKKGVERYISFFMGLSGGVMLAVVVFDLMPEAMEKIGTIETVIAAFAGALITMLMKNKLDFRGNMASGYLIFVSILFHNLPEGLAIGSSFMSAKELGVAIAIIIGIHNVPEGLAMALGMVCNKMSMRKVLFLTMIAGVPMGIGSFFGACFGAAFTPLIGIFLAIAAGTMLYVVIEELFPASKSMYSIFGILIGTIIVKFI